MDDALLAPQARQTGCNGAFLNRNHLKRLTKRGGEMKRWSVRLITTGASWSECYRQAIANSTSSGLGAAGKDELTYTLELQYFFFEVMCESCIRFDSSFNDDFFVGSGE